MAMDGVTIGNVPFWGYLPMGITNFGGDTQVFTIEPWNAAPISMTMNWGGLQAINGDSITPYNNWGYENPIPPDSIFRNPNNNLRVNVPQINPFESIAVNTVQNMAVGFIMQDLSSTMQTITSTKTRLEAMLVQGKYSQEQIDKINELLEELDAIEQELTEFSDNELGDLEIADARARITEYQQRNREIFTKISSIGKPAGNEE